MTSIRSCPKQTLLTTNAPSAPNFSALHHHDLDRKATNKNPTCLICLCKTSTMARSRREKSASVSSAAAPAVNGSMPPPSPPSSSTRSSPVATRRKAPSVSKATVPGQIPQPKSAHAPEKPSIIGFLAAVVVSLVAEAVGQQAASVYNTGELARISKHNVNVYEIGGLLAWKVILLGICWFGGFDGKLSH